MNNARHVLPTLYKILTSLHNPVNIFASEETQRKTLRRKVNRISIARVQHQTLVAVFDHVFQQGKEIWKYTRATTAKEVCQTDNRVKYDEIKQTSRENDEIKTNAYEEHFQTSSRL